jgi:hypothetical protein
LETKNQELKTFYESNGIDYAAHTRMQKESIKRWGIKERQILDEMDRQELSLDQESGEVTMLFAMKWFNSDLTNKGMNSDLVKGLLLGEQDGKPAKAKSQNELMALVYLSYLETNNYLKCDQKYLFGDLVQSISKPIHQEQVLVFLEMLKIYYPSGDSLCAPMALQDVE